jgi:hypothetical protein
MNLVICYTFLFKKLGIFESRCLDTSTSTGTSPVFCRKRLPTRVSGAVALGHLDAMAWHKLRYMLLYMHTCIDYYKKLLFSCIPPTSASETPEQEQAQPCQCSWKTTHGKTICAICYCFTPEWIFVSISTLLLCFGS